MVQRILLSNWISLTRMKDQNLKGWSTLTYSVQDTNAVT